MPLCNSNKILMLTNPGKGNDCLLQGGVQFNLFTTPGKGNDCLLQGGVQFNLLLLLGILSALQTQQAKKKRKVCNKIWLFFFLSQNNAMGNIGTMGSHSHPDGIGLGS